jgi:hypothetical protein
MTTRLNYDSKNTPFGRMLAQAAAALIAAQQQWNRINAAVQSMDYGDTGTHARVVTEFGLDAGTGGDLTFKAQAICDALNASTVKDIVAQLDQG